MDGCSQAGDFPEFGWNDVVQHQQLWTVIDGQVLDITNWIGEHPGGSSALLKGMLDR